MLYCQARHDEDGDGKVSVQLGPHGALSGDPLHAYLNLGGSEQPVEEVLAIAASGRYIAYRQAGHPWLYDTERRAAIDLGALRVDGTSAATRYATHRSFSFDTEANRFSYLFWQGQSLTVGLLSLPSGKTTTLPPPDGSVFLQRLSPSGELVVVESVVEDSSGNGRLDWPVPPAKRPVQVCQPPVSPYPAWLSYGDRTSLFVASTAHRTWRKVPDFVAPFGSRLLLKHSDGRLLLDNEGTEYQLSPAKCNAKVLHADPERSLVLVACPGDEVPALKNPVFLVGPGLNQPLGIEVGPSGRHRWPEGSPRFVPLYPGSEVVLVDMVKRRLFPLEPNDLVLKALGDRVLLRRNDKLLLIDPDKNQQVAIGPLATLLDYEITEPWAWVRPWLVNLENPGERYKRDQQVLALSSTGSVLVAESESSPTELAQGPLRWIPRD